jgi:dolichol-phosphate mannosyltransferase
VSPDTAPPYLKAGPPTGPPELTVIIPTYREEENIGAMVREVSRTLADHGIRGEILVVDDSSPDRTIPLVRDLEKEFPSVRLVVRTADPGLSQSVVEGFREARGGVIQVIDADFSHPVALIPEFFRRIRAGADVVIGSRYMAGGGIGEWPLSRRVISLGATALGRILFPEITDPVSGFFAVRREVVEGAPLQPRGYKILMEVLGKGRWMRAVEVPYTFENRKVGASKLRVATILEYAAQVADISVHALSRREGAAWRELRKILRFALVGLSGIVVNTGILWALTERAGLYYLYSSAVAIETSIITNFLLNDFWTFGGESGHRMGRRIHRFLSFQVVSLGGLVVNMAVLYIGKEIFGIYYLVANLLGILAAFIWNYLVNRHLTWKVRS